MQVVFSRAEEGGLNGARNLDFSLGSCQIRHGVRRRGTRQPQFASQRPAQNIIQANITGVAAHAGLEPENGVSALLVAANILTRLPLGRIDDETTSNIGLLQGGLKRNIIPEHAYLDGELRSRNQAKLENYSARIPGALSTMSPPCTHCAQHRPQHVEPVPGIYRFAPVIRPWTDISRCRGTPSGLSSDHGNHRRRV